MEKKWISTRLFGDTRRVIESATAAAAACIDEIKSVVVEELAKIKAEENKAVAPHEHTASHGALESDSALSELYAVMHLTAGDGLAAEFLDEILNDCR